jgi:hypothetical protein
MLIHPINFVIIASKHSPKGVNMDTTKHNLSTLFDQLGLASGHDEIEAFFAEHRIDKSTPLANAPFWNEAQRQFLTESIEQDADWAEMIDMIDVRLREG